MMNGLHDGCLTLNSLGVTNPPTPPPRTTTVFPAIEYLLSGYRLHGLFYDSDGQGTKNGY